MNPRVLALKNPKDLFVEFKKIGVDKGGIPIMLPKGFSRLVKISDIPCFWANVLKQEMLSLGGDVALSRGSLTGRDKRTDCLLMGNLSLFCRLAEKLKKQPFGLSQTGREIKRVLERFDKKNTILDIDGKKMSVSRRTLVMGIVNATPDSFSGDGILGMGAKRALAFAQEMVKNGADILDVGGESSRPGSKKISAKEEVGRILPLLKLFKKSISVPISVDTTKSEVARAALDEGASIINDISALRFDKKMAKLVARRRAGVVLMHMKGSPATMQKAPRYDDLLGEIVLFLSETMKKALDAGISEDRIIVDPGIGFGKTLEHNLEILRRLSELKSLGRPVLVGVSRKWFIGKILNVEAQSRLWGTIAAMSLAIANGADIVRVHDVSEMKQAALVADAICA
jgi:dihydropteroate synthase